MASEIERKYVVDTSAWRPVGEGVRLVQGYLSSNPERVVRVRIEGAGAKLTIKGPVHGITRAEFEYAIPPEDAAALLELCEKPLVDKHRHVEVHHGTRWEIDVFHGENDGLVVAEVELASEDQAFTVPAFAVRDVTGDARYYNSNLLANPYARWKAIS